MSWLNIDTVKLGPINPQEAEAKIQL